MTFVKISETYDLSTKVDKMGIIGVHTPSVDNIKRVWGNLFKAHQKFRFDSCDITIACASMLPADPLQIGVEAGKIAPQDMFNPILYTAVSNDSFNRITSRIYGANNVNNITGGAIGSLCRDEIDSTDDAYGVYYALLAEPDGWRKAMPQAGLEMHGLYPIVYQMVNTFGNTVGPYMLDQSEQYVPTPDDYVGGSESQPARMVHPNKAMTFRGPSMKMPAIPTAVVNVADVEGVGLVGGVDSPEVMPTYVACIVTPPAKLNVLYYRMKVTWTIELTGLRSDLESATLGNIAAVGNAMYGTDYASQSANMSTVSSSVDVKDADLELVMTSAR